MIDLNTVLTIKHEASGVFTDYSHELVNFGKDPVDLTLDSTLDYLYVGFHKPVNALYVDITAPDGTKGTLEAEFYNGAWSALENTSDDTRGFFRSGFIKWEREQANQTPNTIDGDGLYWYRFRPSETRTSITLSGINLVFSDDYDLSLEQPMINDEEFRGDQESHILYHEASKREILQKFKNMNYLKIDPVSGDYEDINCWDLLDIEEVGLASTYLTLSKIYNAMSDNPDDVWKSKSKEFEAKFNKYIQLARLSLDTDNDGLESAGENKQQLKNKFMHR